MTVNEAKQQIGKILESLREDGIVVQEIEIGWIAEVPVDRVKPEAKMRCSLTFKADL